MEVVIVVFALVQSTKPMPNEFLKYFSMCTIQKRDTRCRSVF